MRKLRLKKINLPIVICLIIGKESDIVTGRESDIEEEDELYVHNNQGKNCVSTL